MPRSCSTVCSSSSTTAKTGEDSPLVTFARSLKFRPASFTSVRPASDYSSFGPLPSSLSAPRLTPLDAAATARLRSSSAKYDGDSPLLAFARSIRFSPRSSSSRESVSARPVSLASTNLSAAPTGIPSSSTLPMDSLFRDDAFCARPAARTALRESALAIPGPVFKQMSFALKNGWAASTISNYSYGLKKFLTFCDSIAVPEHLRLPAEELLLCAFAGSFAGAKSRSSAQNCLSAVRAWHTAQGHTWSGDARLARVVAGVERLAPRSSARPL